VGSNGGSEWELVDLAEELGHEAAGGAFVELLGGAVLLDTATVEDDDLVRDLEGFLLVVGDEEGGDVDLVVEAAEPGAELVADTRVEGAEGLIEEEDLRFRREGAGEGDALALAAGELRGVAVCVAVELDEAEEIVDAALDLGPGPLADLEAERDVLPDGHVAEEGIVLEDEAHSAELNGDGGGVLSGEDDASRVGFLESGDDAEDGALAGARGSEEGDELAGVDFEGDRVDGLEGTESLGDVVDDDAHGKGSAAGPQADRRRSMWERAASMAMRRVKESAARTRLAA
jgi:hypothetical protein